MYVCVYMRVYMHAYMCAFMSGRCEHVCMCVCLRACRGFESHPSASFFILCGKKMKKKGARVGC